VDKRQPRCAGVLPSAEGFPLPFLNKETDGSLKRWPEPAEGFPDYPFENMPRSQLQTSVVSYKLTITFTELLPSVRFKAVGFLPIKYIKIIY
jgi:hypothetical protein